MLPVLLRLGPITLHTYGLMVACGFLAGVAVARRTFAAANLPPALVDRLAVMLLLSGLLGARIMFFAVDGFVGLANDPLAFFRIWEGGLVFYGGVIGGLIALVIFSRRSRIPLIVLTDAFAPALLIGHAFGRLGCFSAGCCYGKISGRWPGVIFTSPDTLAPRFVALIPTQLYEAAAVTLLFFGAMIYLRTRPPAGRMTIYYLLTYSVERFLMEFLRGDDRGAPIFGLSPSQMVSLICFFVALGLFV